MTSSLLAPTTDTPLTPAMLTALWVIAHELDRQRIPATVEDAVWLEIPSAQLRGQHGRDDNVWLRECLERVTGIKIGGEYRSNPWGAVLVSEWHIVQGGSLTRILVPPAGVQALRLSETFAKIELEAAYRLQGPARRLYAALADKKRMGKPHWTYSLKELRALFGVAEKKSYERWGNFRQWVLLPALEQINDFGTVTVKMTPEKRGRSVVAVRFDWRWKSLDEARETDEENKHHKTGRRKDKEQKAAPPLVPEEKERALEMFAEIKANLTR